MKILFSSAITLLLLLNINTCTGQQGSVDKLDVEKLESVLYQLTKAVDYREFSENRGLFLSDDRVRVVIELKGESTIAKDYPNVIIERYYKDLIRAFVPIDDLIPLAREDYVRFIRTPHEPVPHIPTPPLRDDIK